MIFLDVTELSLIENLKPIEEKRKKGISYHSESLIAIKLMTFYALDGSLGLEKKFLNVLPLSTSQPQQRARKVVSDSPGLMDFAMG